MRRELAQSTILKVLLLGIPAVTILVGLEDEVGLKDVGLVSEGGFALRVLPLMGGLFRLLDHLVSWLLFEVGEGLVFFSLALAPAAAEVAV